MSILKLIFFFFLNTLRIKSTKVKYFLKGYRKIQAQTRGGYMDELKSLKRILREIIQKAQPEF